LLHSTVKERKLVGARQVRGRGEACSLSDVRPPDTHTADQPAAMSAPDRGARAQE